MTVNSNCVYCTDMTVVLIFSVKSISELVWTFPLIGDAGSSG